MAHWLFLPEDALDDLSAFSDLSTSQIEKLGRILEEDEGAKVSSLYLKIAETLAIGDDTAADLYGLFDYAQDERSRNNQTGTAVFEEFESFLKTRSKGKEGSKAEAVLKKLQEKRGLLINLFGDSPRRDHAKKIRHLKNAPLPHLHIFRLYCDFRPVFDKEAEKIVGGVPNITLRMVTHAGQERPQDIVVQLDDEDLGVIRKQLERLQKKMRVLKAQFGDLFRMVKDESRGN